MQSNTDHRHHEQHQQQQTAIRPHTRLRRSHSPLYNYTALWAHDLLSRGPHTSHDSSTSTNPLNPIAVSDHMGIDRQRWTRRVCVGFLVCFLVNIFSIVYVTVTLSSVDDVTDSSLLQQFMSQAS